MKIKLIKGECPPIESIDPSLPAARSVKRKLKVKENLEQFKFKGVIAGIRRDEQNTRAKERIFSPRDEMENGIRKTSHQNFGIIQISIIRRVFILEYIHY